MKCASVVKAAAAVAVVVGMVGCTDLKPIQAQIDDLKAQVAKNASDVAGVKSSADSANSAAQSASQAASGAQSTANQALAAAHASQSCCDATNEKIDRMFKRSVSKETRSLEDQNAAQMRGVFFLGLSSAARLRAAGAPREARKRPVKTLLLRF
jgi:murein lipoprotein